MFSCDFKKCFKCREGVYRRYSTTGARYEMAAIDLRCNKCEHSVPLFLCAGDTVDGVYIVEDVISVDIASLIGDIDRVIKVLEDNVSVFDKYFYSAIKQNYIYVGTEAENEDSPESDYKFENVFKGIRFETNDEQIIRLNQNNEKIISKNLENEKYKKEKYSRYLTLKEKYDT